MNGMTEDEFVDALIAQDRVAAKLLASAIRHFLEDIEEYASWFNEEDAPNG
jgi:transaldolase